MKQKWVPSTSNSPLPSNAVVGGYDCDRSPIYVGRALHEGHQLLAKVVPSKSQAYVCWEGCEIAKTEYEVLTGESHRWYECFVGTMPKSAVRMGRTPTGEQLYIGRGHFEGSLTVGTFDFTKRKLSITFGGQERLIECCEILAYHTPPHWMAATLKNIPKDAVIGGHEGFKNKKIYVGRVLHDGEMLPAKISVKAYGAYVSVAGEDFFSSQFEFLTGDGYRWVPGKHYRDLPLGAVPSGKTRDGEFIYIGRGNYNGDLTPGKVFPTQYCVYIPYGGKEIKITDYEVLVKNT